MSTISLVATRSSPPILAISIELMPFAKAVSAKSHDFNDAGQETHTDYLRMMKIVLSAGYSGYVGIEFEGDSVSEDEGILKTKKLLERVRKELVG